MKISRKIVASLYFIAAILFFISISFYGYDLSYVCDKPAMVLIYFI